MCNKKFDEMVKRIGANQVSNTNSGFNPNDFLKEVSKPVIPENLDNLSLDELRKLKTAIDLWEYQRQQIKELKEELELKRHQQLLEELGNG